MTESRWARRNEAPHRESEAGAVKGHSGSNSKSGETKQERARGRPKGSKNKPKALISKEVAQDLLGVVKQTLPPELYDEMRDAVKSGKNISSLNEAKILLKMMGPPIWQRLIMQAEAQKKISPDIIDEFDEEQPDGWPKDLNEQVKTYISLLQLVDKMEGNEDKSDNSEKPILEVFARRGIDSEHVKFLLGVESGTLGIRPDGTGREATDIGAIPSEVPERQIDVQDSEQEQTTRVLDLSSVRNDTQGVNES